MKASYLGAMGYAHRRDFLPTWPTPPSYSDPETSVQSYQDGMEECEFAEEMGFEWVSFSEHHYSGRIATGTPAVMAAAVAERCKTIKIAMLGPLMPLNNPVPAEELTLLDRPPRHGIPARHAQRGPGVRRQSRRGTRPHAGGHGPHPEGHDRAPSPSPGRDSTTSTARCQCGLGPVQQPFPAALVATRSDDAVRYAAEHHLGLGVSFIPVDDRGRITDKYHA